MFQAICCPAEGPGLLRPAFLPCVGSCVQGLSGSLLIIKFHVPHLRFPWSPYPAHFPTLQSNLLLLTREPRNRGGAAGRLSGRGYGSSGLGF